MRKVIISGLIYVAIILQIPICDAVEYKIINDDAYLTIKRSVDVRIVERVSEAELRAIAEKINAADPTKYDRIFIMFYLPEMEIDAGAWASAIFNPKLEVKILGNTLEQYENFTKNSDDVEGKVLGKWYWERPYASATYTLVENCDSLFFKINYQDGSKREITVDRANTKNSIRYIRKDENSYGEYYVVSSDGKLNFYDMDGLIGSAEIR